MYLFASFIFTFVFGVRWFTSGFLRSSSLVLPHLSGIGFSDYLLPSNTECCDEDREEEGEDAVDEELADKPRTTKDTWVGYIAIDSFAISDKMWLMTAGPMKDVPTILTELWVDAGIRVHEGKTQIWNAAGEFPPGCEVLEQATVAEDPTAMVWRGCEDLPSHRRGIKILDTSLGHKNSLLLSWRC